MTIISYSFLLLFLPVSLLLYWFVFRAPHLKIQFLCVISYLFYALAGAEFVILLLALSIATYGLAQRKYFSIGIVLNLLFLAMFKYWNFGADNLNALSEILAISEIMPAFRLALPIGLSFYTFKHIGYLLDVRQDRYAATDDFLVFITYSAFLPQITAGPLSGFDNIARQLRNLPTQLNTEQIYWGLVSISIGLVKKFVVADTINTSFGRVYTMEDSVYGGLIWGWSVVILFAVQIYFDFSGYTDIVLGIGQLFGVTLPPNFNNPYLAKTPAQFWQHWHISLSLWFRVYLFMPISRSLLRRWGMQRASIAQYTANIVTMTLVGLWHGAGWGFMLWGLYHGLLLNVYAWANRRRIAKVLTLPGIMFIALLFGWALFLSPDLAFANNLLQQMVGLKGIGTLESLATFDKEALIATFAGLLIIALGLVEAENLPRVRSWGYGLGYGILTILALLHVNQSVEFIYMQF